MVNSPSLVETPNRGLTQQGGASPHSKAAAHLFYPPEALPASDEVRQQLSVVICRLRAETTYGETMSSSRSGKNIHEPRQAVGSAAGMGPYVPSCCTQVHKLGRVERQNVKCRHSGRRERLVLDQPATSNLARLVLLPHKPGTVQLKAIEQQQFRKSTRK